MRRMRESFASGCCVYLVVAACGSGGSGPGSSDVVTDAGEPGHAGGATGSNGALMTDASASQDGSTSGGGAANVGLDGSA